METVAFYSYKGGVGRSLLLANAARFLATLGKGVVALDFDFEAPGLHYKFGVAHLLDVFPFLGGAVPYLIATAEGTTSPPPFEEHAIFLPVPTDADGWLRLMPAGPAPHQTYWSAFKELGDKLRLGDPSGRGFMALLDLQARIADELKPDYLLIDARTGVTELGGLATTILADTVVCMFVGNHESLDGTLTVVEALKTVPRLKDQDPIRVVPVLSRAPKPPDDDRFAAGVKKLLELGEGNKSQGKNEPALFALPHDDVLGASERVVGGEQKASAFSPLYKAYLELFQTLFPSGAEPARQVLKRLEAVARIKEELTSSRERYGFDDLLPPWSASAIQEGYEIETRPKKGTRYADLLCSDETGKPLMAVVYVGDGDADEALEFWGKNTKARCVVLLVKGQYSIERRIFTRERDWGSLRSTKRRDLPRPREFELLRNVGDRSIEAMLEAVGHGHAEAVAWLVNEWRDASGAGDEKHLKRRPVGHWRPERAQRILDGLAATEDPQCAEEILRRARPGAYDFRHHKHHFREDWGFGEDLEEKIAEDLFAPLFWRLPVEAVLESMRDPGDWGSLAGYRLLAQQLMGLRYDPDRSALEEARARSARLPVAREHRDDREDERALMWRYRSRQEQSERVRLSEEAPPALFWEEVLLEEPYWRGTLEEAKEKVGEKVRTVLESTVGLRRRLKEIGARRELATQGLLGNYESSGRIELYPQVITATAEVLAVSPRYLKSVVFIHLSTWAMAYEAYDLDGQPGYGFAPSARTSRFSRESPAHVALVQAFTERLIRLLRDPNLQAAFEKLSKQQPEPYTRWEQMRKLPLEKLHMLLLAARASAPALGLPGAEDSQ